MKNLFKHRKNRILNFCIIFVGILCLGVFIQGCSNDDMDNFNGFTAKEKAQIMKLADKYELNITLYEDFTGKKPTMKEIEKLFKSLASVKGEYEFVKSEDNRVISQKKVTKKPRLKNSAEQGSWSETYYADDADVFIGVGWDVRDYPYTWNVEADGNITLKVDGILGTIVGDTHNYLHAMLTGGKPNFMVTFSGSLTFIGEYYAENGKKMMDIHRTYSVVNGCVSTSTGNGSCMVY